MLKLLLASLASLMAFLYGVRGRLSVPQPLVASFNTIRQTSASQLLLLFAVL